MLIIVGCHVLCSVVDDLFAELKGEFVFNFVDNLVVCSPCIKEHHAHLREVLRRLKC
jgi:hypothetical protein